MTTLSLWWQNREYLVQLSEVHYVNLMDKLRKAKEKLEKLKKKPK